MLEIKNVSVIFHQNTVNEKVALDGVNLYLEDGDFVTVIGSNGAGKSTLLGLIAGNVEATYGHIYHNHKDITFEKEYLRARYIGRLYQDPLKGTAPNMTIEENLGLAYSRGQRMRLGLGLGVRKAERALFYQACKGLGLGLEQRMGDMVGLLSGGQRQALTLLMATLQVPKLLLLDEHTAALDPMTAAKIMQSTNDIIAKHRITTLMITHNIEQALKFGNKTIVMGGGKILKILSGEERKNMTVSDMIQLYTNQTEMVSDKMVLGI